MEQNSLSNFHRGSSKEHFCETMSDPATGLRNEVVYRYFLPFLALVPILIIRALRFKQFR